MNDIDSMISEESLLSIVKEGFEEVEGIKILSLSIHENTITGIYIIPPQQTLSFIDMPRFCIQTDFHDKTIWIQELGQILYKSYREGSIREYNLLTTPSQIKITSYLFNELVNKCINNPPQNQINARLIEWLQLTDEVFPIRTKTFCDIFNWYKQIDNTIEVDTNISTDTHTKSQILNEFSKAVSEIKATTPKKNSELILRQIDELYVTLQTDLYITDDI